MIHDNTKIESNIFKDILFGKKYFAVPKNEIYNSINVGDIITLSSVGDEIILDTEELDEFMVGNVKYHERSVETIINGDCSIIAEVIEIRIFINKHEFVSECDKNDWSFFHACAMGMDLMRSCYGMGSCDKKQIIAIGLKQLDTSKSKFKREIKNPLVPLLKRINKIFGKYFLDFIQYDQDTWSIEVKNETFEIFDNKTLKEIKCELNALNCGFSIIDIWSIREPEEPIYIPEDIIKNLDRISLDQEKF